ncbi:MAG: hypothetical protein M1339_07795 [Bacteroidetes bacterium]|nr:hypothetical protein [Bacteroidota bacterium]
MHLTAPNRNASASTGMTLGGAFINDTGSFQGEWSPLDSTAAGPCFLKVPAASAAIVKIGGTLPPVSQKIDFPGKFAEGNAST